MHALSCHVSLDAMEQELDGVLEDAKVLGLDTVAMAWSAADSPEAVARAVRVLQAAQSAAEPHGVRILYHNHSHELRPVDGCAAKRGISSKNTGEIKKVKAGAAAPAFVFGAKQDVRPVKTAVSGEQSRKTQGFY